MNSELYIFSSDDPLKGRWKSYEKNPIILNPNYARNGGYIIDKNEFYRVYQTHNFNEYGNSIGIDKLIINSQSMTLVKRKFKNKKILKYVNKLHHLNSDGIYTVYDYVN